VHDERGDWVGSAGVRKLGEAAKPPTTGRFRIGGNTKTFVATVVLQLVAEGSSVSPRRSRLQRQRAYLSTKDGPAICGGAGAS
jgi:hypothetical protein